ncbi:hypothetical protein [Sphingopyxis sp.]|uniref:hypothetical protein n=1 Tax=Sphingopyxis sp. TaxID=1908224 RepID=UPI003D12807A
MWRPSGLICGSDAMARSNRSAPVRRRSGAVRALPTADADVGADAVAGAAAGVSAGAGASCARLG